MSYPSNRTKERNLNHTIKPSSNPANGENDSGEFSAISSLSLYIIAFALILYFCGDIQMQSSRQFSFWAMARTLCATIFVWWLNSDIAAGLKRRFSTGEGNTHLALFKFNFIAVVFMGLYMIGSCFDPDPDEDTKFGIIVSAIAVMCWSVTQILVAFKLMANGGTLTGVSILATVVTSVAGGIWLSDLTIKHNEVLFYGIYGIEFVALIAMYASYKKFFNSFNNM